MTIWDVIGVNARIGQAIAGYVSDLLNTVEEAAEVVEAASNATETMSVITEAASDATETMSVIADVASNATETMSVIAEVASNATEAVSNISTLAFSNASGIVPNITNATSAAADIITNFTDATSYFAPPEGLGEIVSQFDIETAFELATEYSPWVAAGLAITGTVALGAAAIWRFCFGAKQQDSSQQLQSAIEQYSQAMSSTHNTGVASTSSSGPLIFSNQLPVQTICISYSARSKAARDAGRINFTGADGHTYNLVGVAVSEEDRQSTILKALGLQDPDSGTSLGVSEARADEIRRAFPPL